MKLKTINIHIVDELTGCSTLTPIQDFSEDIDIKIDEYGSITINGEIMVMLKAIAHHDQIIHCSYSDTKLDAETNDFVPDLPRGGISTAIGYYRGHGVLESDNYELFDRIITEYGDDNMWKRTSFKELFTDLIRDHTNSNGKCIWRKTIEKARKFIIDSFDEALNEYKDYEDKDEKHS